MQGKYLSAMFQLCHNMISDHKFVFKYKVLELEHYRYAVILVEMLNRLSGGSRYRGYACKRVPGLRNKSTQWRTRLYKWRSEDKNTNTKMGKKTVQVKKINLIKG